MESKLPKPSGLKRPTPVPRSILPMDRIKANNIINIGSKASQFLNSLQPLSRDIGNIPERLARTVRAKTPEMRSEDFNSRVKLRRSRSACEIRNMRPLKRTDSTIAPIPAKIQRFGNSNTTTLNHTVPHQQTTITRTTKNMPAVKRQPPTSTITRAPITNRNLPAAATAAAKKTTSSVSTTGAGKPISKRIPPYDFKARFNDLLEKHKVLKQKYDINIDQMGNLESLPEQLEESQTQLFATQEELKNSKTECECLQRQIKSQNMKIETLTNSFVKTKESLDKLTEEHERLKTTHEKINAEVLTLREKTKQLSEENKIFTESLELCREQLFNSNIERKELHNTVMDLRGNIRVFCRVRPPLDCEEDKVLCGWNYIDEATVEIQNPDLIGKNKAAAHTFAFDQVFHPNTRQDDIFELVSPLIQSALDGYNICIFAYGQTGSGKTYTMDGISTNVGVIPRTVDLLFDSVKNYKRLGWEYEIKVTFLEIYNEVLYDLLSNEPKDMEIRMKKNCKNDIYVSNITEVTVDTAGHLRELMQVAKMNRATAATAGNERSSRSHAVTKIELIGHHKDKNEISVGKINLVDLAGSESPKTSIRMNETKNINRSLSELTNVILALLQKQDHIPYRNSKLTHLLMPSLGGNSKTLMFINVAPFVDCFVESVKSLRFAASVNSCKMAKAKRNRYLNTSTTNS